MAENQQKTLLGGLTRTVIHDRGAIGQFSRGYLSPQSPDRVDDAVEKTKDVAITTGYILGYGTYYLVSGTLSTVVDFGFWAKSVVWRRPNTDNDPNDVELEVIEGEDDFVLMGNSEVNDMNNVL